jgi:hypothetical protein
MGADWLPWAPLGAGLLHISEEFVLPGGFAAWYRPLSSRRLLSHAEVLVHHQIPR